MPLPLSPEQKAALRAGRIETGFLLDLFVDGESLHCSTLYSDISYDVGDGVTRAYEPLADRWSHGEQAITMGTDLEPVPLNLSFDASRAGDDSDFVGRFVDSQWHRRRARLTEVTFLVGSSRFVPIAPVFTWEGEMDFADFPESVGTPPTMLLTLESGTFRYLGTNVQTRTDENQQRFFPGDTFFQDLPGLIGRELPWHRNWVKSAPTSGTQTTSSPSLWKGKYG